MRIDISEVISDDFTSRSYEAPIEMDVLEFEGCEYPAASKEPVRMHLVNKGKSRVALEGSVRMTVLIPCSRCLKDVAVPFDFTSGMEMDFEKIRSGFSDDIDEYSFIDGNYLDVDRFVRNELIVRLPAKVLCKEDCAGICPVCGKDLNEGECGCDRTPADLRMSAIRDIFNEFKEEV